MCGSNPLRLFKSKSSVLWRDPVKSSEAFVTLALFVVNKK